MKTIETALLMAGLCVLMALAASCPAPGGGGLYTPPGSPTAKYAYLITNSNTINSFTVGTTGALTPLNDYAVTGTGPNGIAVHPTLKVLYVLNYGTDNVSQYTIGTDGSLAAMTIPVVAAGQLPNCIAVCPSGKYAYVVMGYNYNSTKNSVFQYNIDPSTGSLTYATAIGVSAANNLCSMAIDPLGKYAYVGESNGFVYQFLIGSNGALSAMTPPSIAAGSTFGYLTGDVAIPPLGNYLYALNGDDTRYNQKLWMR